MDNSKMDFYLKLKYDYRLVTIGVFYFLPEHQNILQEFIWQTEDRVPELFRVHKFIKHWNDNIEADIQEVRISYPDPFKIPDFQNVKYEFPVIFSV